MDQVNVPNAVWPTADQVVAVTGQKSRSTDVTFSARRNDRRSITTFENSLHAVRD